MFAWSNGLKLSKKFCLMVCNNDPLLFMRVINCIFTILYEKNTLFVFTVKNRERKKMIREGQ